MDSRGASQVISAANGGGTRKKQYQISQNSLLFDLSMPDKDLKFISVNMLARNLKLIDL